MFEWNFIVEKFFFSFIISLLGDSLKVLLEKVVHNERRENEP